MSVPSEGRENSELLRPKERENSGVLPLTGRESSKLLRPKERKQRASPPSRGRQEGDGVMGRRRDKYLKNMMSTFLS